MQPSVAVAVFNYNKRDLLLICLEKVLQQEFQPSYLLVVDDCSTDGSVEAVRSTYPTIPIERHSKQMGVIAVRNTGLRHILSQTDSTYIVLLDNDSLMEPDVIKRMVDIAEGDSSIGLLTPKILSNRTKRAIASAGGMKANLWLGRITDIGAGEIDHGQYDAPAWPYAAPGGMMFLRRAAVERVGEFDENLRYYGWEDFDYSYRIGQAGYRLRYEPKAEVEHIGGQPGRGIVKEYEQAKADNLFTIMRKHATPAQRFVFYCILPFRGLALMGKYISHGEWGIIWVMLGYVRRLFVRR